MIVEFSAAGGLRLVEPDNFRAFKLLLRGPFDTARPVIAGVRFVDDGNALVERDAVPGMAGAPDTPEWRQGYEAMVAAAAKYGWIEPETGAIRAHVERAP